MSDTKTTIELREGDLKNILWMIQTTKPQSVDHGVALAQLRTVVHAAAQKAATPDPDTVPERVEE